jgi:hypothetical protein
MDLVQAAADARRRNKESDILAASAKKDPRGTSSGGGFRANAPGSGSDKAADAPGKYDGGLSGGVVHSVDDENNVRDKAASGAMLTNDDLGYMGHFANDDVMRRGHNSGMKKVGKAAVTAHAKRGYRKLPGTAVNQIGHAKFGDAPTGLPENSAGAKGMRMKQAPDASVMSINVAPMARGISDMKMSVKHHQQSMQNDKRHMLDHQRSMDRHAAAIKAKKKQLRKK